MAATNQYLQDNLHYRPLSAHLGRATVWTATELQKNASDSAWHGRIVTVLSKTIVAVAALACIPLSLIELVSSFVLASIAGCFNKILFDNRSEFLQKHTLKLLSFSIHSALGTVALVFLFYKNCRGLNLKCHTLSAVVDHSIHLGIAIFVQATYGAYLDRQAGRDEKLFATRIINLFRDSHPRLIQDLRRQIERDAGILLSVLRERIVNAPAVSTYLGQHLEARNFIMTFDLGTFISSVEYRRQAVGIVGSVLTDLQLASPMGAQQWDLNQHRPDESRYQDHLAQLIKEAFLEIHNKPDLWHGLDQEELPGNELLECMDATTFTPLAAAAAYREILEDGMYCPEQFDGNLAQYNGRREQIIEAKQIVGGLTQAQKDQLYQKIIRGSDYNVDNQCIQEAFLKISALAAPINQGPLMTKTVINMEFNNSEIVESRKLFQTAYQEALSEI